MDLENTYTRYVYLLYVLTYIFLHGTSVHQRTVRDKYIRTVGLSWNCRALSNRSEYAYI